MDDSLKQTAHDFDAGRVARKLTGRGTRMTVRASMKWKDGFELKVGEKVDVYFSEANTDSFYVFVGNSWRKGPNIHGFKYLSGFTKEPSQSMLQKYSFDGISKSVTGKRVEPDGYGEDNSPSWLLVLGLMECKRSNKYRELFLECVREVFQEGISQGTETDVRGMLGYPFDKYIVPGTIKVDDGDGSGEIFTYTWKIQVPVDAPDILSSLNEDEETFEEKLLEAIADKLRSPAIPGKQYTTGHGEVVERKVVNGKKVLTVQIEMTVGWDI